MLYFENKSKYLLYLVTGYNKYMNKLFTGKDSFTKTKTSTNRNKGKKKTSSLNANLLKITVNKFLSLTFKFLPR